MGINSLYNVIPEWNDGKTERPEVPPVNIFDSLDDDKLKILLEKIQQDEELAAFYEQIRRLMELEKIDYEASMKEIKQQREELSDRLIIKRFFDTLISGTKKEQTMAGRVLQLKSSL